MITLSSCSNINKSNANLEFYKNPIASDSETPNTLIFSFIKSAVTLDTALFYAVIDNDSIINNLKAQILSDMNRLNSQNLHEIYFYQFGPLKIQPKNLDSLRRTEFPLIKYGIETIEQRNNYCFVHVNWIRTSTSNSSNIHLTLRKMNMNWKIISITSLN